MKFTAIVAFIAAASAVTIERDNGSDWGLSPTRIWVDGPTFNNDPNQRAAVASQKSQKQYRAVRSVFEAYPQKNATLAAKAAVKK